MDEWEFLRRPSKAKKAPETPETIVALVVFGGTEKKFTVSRESTFEVIYEDYEKRFASEFVLTYRESFISRYTKIKSIVPPSLPDKEKEEAYIDIILVMKEKEGSGEEESKTATVYYTVRYNKYATVEIIRDNEVTVEDLHKSVISKLPKKENKTLTNTALSFDGDVLMPAEEISTILATGDLIDLIDI